MEWWLPGVEGKDKWRECSINIVSVWIQKRIPMIGGGDGCATM